MLSMGARTMEAPPDAVKTGAATHRNTVRFAVTVA